jgi:hypothetical protein
VVAGSNPVALAKKPGLAGLFVFEGASVVNQMSQFRATANAHMRRDMAAAPAKWLCECEACKEIRSLMGMEKTLEVRQRVRELRDIEERLAGLPDGPARQELLDHFLKLYDDLADEMAK